MVDRVQSYDDNLHQSNLTPGTRERSSQTDFPEDFQPQAVLGQYIETKLRPDFNELRVPSDREIVIVEYEQEEII